MKKLCFITGLTIGAITTAMAVAKDGKVRNFVKKMF